MRMLYLSLPIIGFHGKDAISACEELTGFKSYSFTTEACMNLLNERVDTFFTTACLIFYFYVLFLLFNFFLRVSFFSMTRLLAPKSHRRIE